MAELDSNLILQAKPVQLENPLDAMTRAMTMRELAQRGTIQDRQIQDDQAARDAFKANVNPDGTVDRQGVLSALAKTGNGKQVLDYQKMFQNQDLEKLKYNSEAGKNLAWSVSDEPSYQLAKAQYQKMGLPGLLPDRYDPAFVKNWQMHSLEGDKQLDAHMRQQEIGIKQKEADNNEKRLQFEQISKFGGLPPGMSEPAQEVDPKTGLFTGDPADLVKSRVPEARQKEVYEAIKDRQNIAKIAPQALDAFDKAAKESRLLTGGTDTSISALNPFDLTPSQHAFLGLVGTTVKETEGTSRAQAFKNIEEHFMPKAWDSDAKVAEKRKAFLGYVASHAAAPVAKGNGIDLDRYSKTVLPNEFSNSAPTEGPHGATVVQGGHTYNWNPQTGQYE